MPDGMERKSLIGLGVLVTTAAIWVLSAFICEGLVSSTSKKKHELVPPFQLTYLATSLFTIFTPVLLLHQTKKTRRIIGLTKVDNESLVVADDQSDLPVRKAAFWCFPLFFLAQYALSSSLAHTSVTSNTILSTSSSLFAYGLSVLVLNEKFTFSKLICIFLCISGTALVTMSDAEGGGASNPTLGNALTLVGCAMFAGYTVLMRKLLPDTADEDVQVASFLAYMGIFTFITLLPVVTVACATGHLSFMEIPPSAYGLIAFEGIIAYGVADFLWARAVMLLGPTMASLGLVSVQIPLAAVMDLFFGHPVWIEQPHTIMLTVLGTCLILLGFVGVNMTGSAQHTAKQGGEHGGVRIWAFNLSRPGSPTHRSPVKVQDDRRSVAGSWYERLKFWQRPTKAFDY